MAGSEQRPTDDVRGHGVKYHGMDTEAVDEDQVADDTEGHGSRFNGWWRPCNGHNRALN